MKRPIKYSHDLVKRLAKSVVRNNPIRFSVEIITNSDDSFNRLNKAQYLGRITIGVSRAREVSS